jgi:hypothetical protein
MRYFTKARQRTLKSCEGRTVKKSDNEYLVKDYTVYKSRKGWICECKHFIYHQTPCSHIVYVATRRPLVTPKALTSGPRPKLVPVEVKHVANLSNKVVFGQPYDMYGLMSVISVMLPSVLPPGETIRVPPGLSWHR